MMAHLDDVGVVCMRKLEGKRLVSKQSVSVANKW